MKTEWLAITVVVLMFLIGCTTTGETSTRETSRRPSGIDFDFGIVECPHCSHSYFYSYEDDAEVRVKCPKCQTVKSREQ